MSLYVYEDLEEFLDSLADEGLIKLFDIIEEELDEGINDLEYEYAMKFKHGHAIKHLDEYDDPKGIIICLA